MQYFRNAPVLAVLFLFAFFVQVNTATANTVTKCINQPVTLNWSTSGVTTSGCTLAPISDQIPCRFDSSIADKNQDSNSNKPIVGFTSGTCNVQLSCDLPLGTHISNPQVSSATLTIDTTQTWNGSACVCNNGANNPAGGCTTCTAPLVWNGTACVSASCGTASGKTYAYGTAGYAPDTQCSSGGTPSTTAFPTPGNTVNWNCSGVGACSASQSAAPSTFSCNSLPANTNAFAAPDNAPPANTAYTYSSTDTATYCQFNCLNGYAWNGSACVAQTFSCNSLPANTNAFAAPDNTPPANTAYTYSNTDTAAYCQFNCLNGYAWNGTSCVVQTFSCNSLPANANAFAAPDNTPPANTAYTYSNTDTATYCQFNCLGGYSWNGTSCVVTSVGGPDLTAGRVTPTNPVPGTVNLSAVVSNIGDQSTTAGSVFGGGFPNLLRSATNISGAGVTDSLPTVASGALAAGGNISPVFSRVLTAGTYYFQVCADLPQTNGVGSIVESNEGNNCGEWTQVTVGTAVPTPTATLSVNSVGTTAATINSGGSATLIWSSTNAVSCGSADFSTGTGDTTSTNPAGGVSVSPSSTKTYNLSCLNSSGTASALSSVTVTVIDPNVTISASATRVKSPGSSTFAWNATDVTSCTVSGSDGYSSGTVSGPSLSGTHTVNPLTTQTTYTISCQTNSSPITKSATVNVLSLFKEF